MDQKEDIHVSGHPCRDELALMYSWLQPQSVIPVHGEDRHILEHYTFALSQRVPHAVRPHNGQLFHITAKDGPVHVGNVATGRLALDGKRLVEDEGPVMTERRRLCETGFLVVVATVSMDKKKVLGCRSLSRGVLSTVMSRKNGMRLFVKPSQLQFINSPFPKGKSKKDGINQMTLALSDAAERSLHHLFQNSS